MNRVRRDEAKAHAREEEQDRRTQIVDSERRLKLLSGHRLDEVPAEDESSAARSPKDGHGQSRKRRRIAGEDDTDRDMRLAQEEAALRSKTTHILQASNEPLTDANGHIDLFPRSQNKKKNVEAEAERAKKKRDYEDQYTMRFSNAAGFKQRLNAPWYSTACTDDAEAPGQDVWGNDDIRRREREKMRANADDPLAAMKRGVQQLRDVEKSRKGWRAERNKELQELETLEQSRCSGRRYRKRRRHRNDTDILESFSLDSPPKGHKEEDKHHRSRSDRHHGDSQSGSRHVAYEGRERIT